MPYIYCEQAEVTNGLFGERRKYLVVNHEKLRDYRIFIGVRDYGIHLQAAWFFTCEPRFLKRTLSKYTTGNPQALSQQIDFFSQQDLGAFKTVVEGAVKYTVDSLYDELKLDPGVFTRQQRGFLNAW